MESSTLSLARPPRIPARPVVASPSLTLPPQEPPLAPGFPSRWRAGRPDIRPDPAGFLSGHRYCGNSGADYGNSGHPGGGSLSSGRRGTPRRGPRLSGEPGFGTGEGRRVARSRYWG